MRERLATANRDAKTLRWYSEQNAATVGGIRTIGQKSGLESRGMRAGFGYIYSSGQEKPTPADTVSASAESRCSAFLLANRALDVFEFEGSLQTIGWEGCARVPALSSERDTQRPSRDLIVPEPKRVVAN